MNDIEFVDVVKILWRWLWLIITVVAVTVGFLYFRAISTEELYRADVTILVSTPDREDVTATDEYTFTNDRDLIVSTINSFVEIAQYSEVKERTRSALNITDNYDVEVDAQLGSDFVHVSVFHAVPELAQQIANRHAENAIAYFGELRALPATQARQFFSDELVTAQQDLIDAQNALADFHIEHNIISLDSETDIQESVLEQLELERAELVAPNTNPENPRVVSNSDVQNIDNLIAARRSQITELNRLRPEYELLQEEVTDTREDLNAVSNQLNETEMREAFVSQAMFLQIIQQADLPHTAMDNTVKTLTLGAVASLGFAVLLAFFLDYLRFSW